MPENHYLVLGVSADATLDEIKAAYRKEAKKCHPDRSGEDGERFLAVREAYEVLGDPARRRAYDQALARESSRAGTRPAPLRPQRPPAEPLVPGPRGGGAPDPFSAPSLSSLVEELFRRPWDSPAEPPRPPAAGAPREIHFDVPLTAAQARRGGRLRLRLPVPARCPACDGRGGDAFFPCLHCGGSGTVADQLPLEVEFPAGVADGDEGRVSLGRPGTRGLDLVLHFRLPGGVRQV